MSDQVSLTPKAKSCLVRLIFLSLLVCLGATAFLTQSSWLPQVQKQVGQLTKPQPTQIAAPAPTVRPTVPGAPTAVPTKPGQPAPTVAPTTGAPTPDACANLPVLRLAMVPYAPYSLWIHTAVSTACKNGIRIELLTIEEKWQVQWVLDTPVDKYYPPLPSDLRADPLIQPKAGVARALLTTQNSCVLYGDCRVIDVLGQSSGNDVVVVRPGINNWDDALDQVYVGGAVGSVSEYFPKAAAGFCGNRPIGRFEPRLEAEPALKAFRGEGFKVLSIYEPYASDALKDVANAARVLASSKTFAGILDVVVIKKGDYSPTIEKALLANIEAFNAAMQNPQKAWGALYDWAYGPDGSQEKQDLLGYDKFEDWWADMSREALLTGENKAYLFGPGKNVLVQRLAEPQQIFSQALYATFRQNDPNPFIPPAVDPATFIDDRYISKIKSDPRMKLTIQVPNSNIQLTVYAPAATDNKTLFRLPLLTIGFNGTEFTDQVKTREELTKRVVTCLKLFRANFQISAAPDDLAQVRADRVKNLLIRTLGVPENKVNVTTKQGLPAGTLQYTLIGSEE